MEKFHHGVNMIKMVYGSVLIISMSFLKIICKMQWIIFRRLEEAIAHRKAGKYPISSDILDKTIDELKEILSAEK